jgi:hypothetical protein
VEPISPAGPDRGWSLTAGGRSFGGALVAAGLVAAGLTLAFLTTLDSTLASTFGPYARGAGTIPLAATLWWLGLIAGGALLVAGTDRLAVVAAAVRRASRARTPLARALASLLPAYETVSGVVPHDGRPVGPLIVGPFGVAVLGELQPPDRLRRVPGGAWQERAADGWIATEHPLDRVAREAERVRHWLTHGELEFVVRVYAALVTTDEAIPRSPVCAVVPAELLAAWLDGLPGQRSLTDGRRQRLVVRAREATATGRS